MTWIVPGILIGYVAAWAVLLIACVRRREFCLLFADSRKTRLFWLATFVFFNPLLTILYLVFGQLRSPQARPVKLVRDVVLVIVLVGFFVNVPGLTHLWMQPFMGRSIDSGTHFQAHLAVIEASNNTNTSTTSSSSDNSRLACRRIAVIAEGPHPLLYRIGRNLVEQLKKVPAVETVDFHPDGTFPESGGQAPDIFIRLRADTIQEDLLPYCLKLRAQVGAEIGRTLLPVTSYYSTTSQPALLSFNMQVEMSHTSTTDGYESVRYKLAAQNIAENLAETISKTLKQWQDKYGLATEMPSEFYGPYQGSELPEPLKSLNPTLLGSYSGLLEHNETFLRFSVADDAVQAVQGLRDQMVPAGWKSESGNIDSRNIDLRLWKGDRCIHIFQIQRRIVPGLTVVTSGSSNQREPTEFGIHDVESFSESESNAILDRLLVEPVSMERLALFDRMFNKEQQNRFVEILSKQKPISAPMQVRLAEMLKWQGRIEESNQALIRARTLLWSIEDDSSLRTRLKSLAKDLGDEKLAEAKPTEQDLRDAGFAELAAGSGPFETEAPLGVPAVVFCQDKRGEFHTLCLTVTASGNDRDPFSVKHLHRMPGGSSSGSRGGFVQNDGLWQCSSADGFNDLTIAWRVIQTPDKNRFKVSFTPSK